jgi:hypothetical protein
MFRFLVVTLLFSGTAQALEPAQIREKTAPSMVVVRALGDDERLIRTGGGVVIARGQVVTNCHVLAKAKSVQVRHQDVIYFATLQHADVERDLCQLSAPKLPAPAVALGGVQTVRLGQRVYALGFTQAIELSLSEGSVSVLREYLGMPVIQISAAATQGVNWAALFNSDGRLIGITTALVKEPPEAHSAVAADAIAEIPRRAQEALERQAAVAAQGAAIDLRRPSPYAAEWARRIALIEKSQAELSLSSATAILLDISAPAELELLQDHEKNVKSRYWSNAYAMGTDTEGTPIWGGAYAWARPEYAAEVALVYCARASGDSCKVIMTNGDFRLADFVELAKTLVQHSVSNVRQAYLQSLAIFPIETQVGRTSGSHLGQFAYAYTSIRK